MKLFGCLLSFFFVTAVVPPAVHAGDDVVSGYVRWFGRTPFSQALTKVPYDDVCGKKQYPLIHFENKRIEEVVVWLKPYEGEKDRYTSLDDWVCSKAVERRKTEDVVTMTELNISENRCEFKPRMHVVPVGTALNIQNDDRKDHWLVVEGLCLGRKEAVEQYGKPRPVFSFKSPYVKKVPSGGNVSIDLKQRDLVTLRSGFHHWMIGWIVVTDTKLLAVTNNRGEFEIENVLPGTYELHAWHPFLGEKVEIINVPEDTKHDKAVVTYTAVVGPAYQYIEPNLPDMKREIRDSKFEEINP